LEKDHEIVGITKDTTVPGQDVQHLDICDIDKTYSVITRINPDLIIHAAAVSNVDGCEKDPDLAYRVNALGTRNIATACQRFDAVMVYISTDYVFSGSERPDMGYTEFDQTGPQNVYARTKLAGEQFVRQLLNKYYIVRPSWLFGSSRANYLTEIADAFMEGKPINVTDDMVSAPTYVNDLAAAIGELITKPCYGTVHLCNGGFASRYGIAVHLAGLMGAPHSLIRKMTLKELNLAARRPSFSGLNNYIWKLERFKPLRHWQEAAEEFLRVNNYI
jgi:dTDP-4-dehydrorhamnose reductase